MRSASMCVAEGGRGGLGAGWAGGGEWRDAEQALLRVQRELKRIRKDAFVKGDARSRGWGVWGVGGVIMAFAKLFIRDRFHALCSHAASICTSVSIWQEEAPRAGY